MLSVTIGSGLFLLHEKAKITIKNKKIGVEVFIKLVFIYINANLLNKE